MNLNGQDVRINGIQITALNFKKWKMWIAHEQNNLSELTEVWDIKII